MQVIALLLALVSVSFLAMGLGYVPYISLILGVTFGIYGLIKTILSSDPLQTVFLELSLISIIATGYLGYLVMETSNNLYNLSKQDFFLLVASGLITALPLYLFSYATLRLNYSTVGLVNYLNNR